MPTAKAQAVALAARFAAATGQTPHTDETPARIRVEVNLPRELSDAARRIVVAALAEADRYGHDHTSAGAVVWAEVEQRRDK
ncbi:hypothetical protein ACSNOK_17425 [Streptomyces sp. URMC 126]|uniref:hypothetical protein n=1 Tax=Streptomyces sp. URMC 126 TaxID=3423401 RepID=UPI003F1B84BF